MSRDRGSRGGRIGRALALAAVAPLAFSAPAVGQPAGGPPPSIQAVPPVLDIPPAPVVIPALSPAQADVAIRVLRAADGHGLQPKAYLPEGAVDGATLSGAQAAALSDGLLRYARDVKIGRLEPGKFPTLWQVRPAPYDPRPELAQALADNRLQSWLDSLPPRYSGYAALKRGLTRYREIAASGGWKIIPEGSKMELGSTDPRVPALRARLAVEDPMTVATGPAVFDAALEEAVIRAQRRFG
ncbi:MAG: murein L,D-transpeptidase, partial [Phenylobacterium sp.]|nr:murein L,D-transpeptidase [Phenylobacterium sp.]